MIISTCEINPGICLKSVKTASVLASPPVELTYWRYPFWIDHHVPPQSLLLVSVAPSLVLSAIQYVAPSRIPATWHSQLVVSTAEGGALCPSFSTAGRDVHSPPPSGVSRFPLYFDTQGLIQTRIGVLSSRCCIRTNSL